MQRLPSIHLQAWLVPLAGLLLASCVGLQQYHTEPVECVGDPATKCAKAYIEDHPEYLLGFIELDDLGWAWDRNQGLLLYKAIQRELEKGDVLMVVFAHGWKHNASPCDTNVACFRDTLQQLHLTEQALAAGRAEGQRQPRRIIGVYIGWRGLSSSNKHLSQTTFYGRKGTAHKVGSGAVTELLVLLAKIRDLTVQGRDDSITRLVIVGHSFGGALVYSATSQLMMERLAVRHLFKDPVRGLGDLVMLVNPAFEAARYQPLHATATAAEQVYGPDQAPVMAVVTSRGDGATRKAFPAGRFFSAKKDDYRPDMRKEQKESNRIAVGHYEPFRTHFLDTNERTPEPQGRKDRGECGCPFELSQGEMTAARVTAIQDTVKRLRRERLDSGGRLMSFPSVNLRHDVQGAPEVRDKPFIPMQMISVDPQIIQDHNDIYQPAFIDFLRYYIMLASEPLEEGEGGGSPDAAR